MTAAKVFYPDGSRTFEDFSLGIVVEGTSYSNRNYDVGGKAKLAYDKQGRIERNPNGEIQYEFEGNYRGIYVQPSPTNSSDPRLKRFKRLLPTAENLFGS
jgi:hypothetical protein